MMIIHYFDCWMTLFYYQGHCESSSIVDISGPSEDVLAKLKDMKGAGKKRVMRPQPKLDAER